MESTYTIKIHQHRFSSWAASRAAMTSKLCRFRVREGVELLESVGMDENYLLPEIESFDEHHRKLRNEMLVKAEEMLLDNFTHGIAAKLINIYLKARYINEHHINYPKVKVIHPPIDSVLLKALLKHNIGGLKKNGKNFAILGGLK